jgi:hypothetical protein
MSFVNLFPNENKVTLETTENNIRVTSDITHNTVEVTQPITKVIHILTGPKGDRGDSFFLQVSENTFASDYELIIRNNLTVTGNLTVENNSYFSGSLFLYPQETPPTVQSGQLFFSSSNELFVGM